MIVEVSDGLSAGLIANRWGISMLLSPANDGDDGLLCFGWGIHVSEHCRVACEEEGESSSIRVIMGSETSAKTPA